MKRNLNPLSVHIGLAVSEMARHGFADDDSSAAALEIMLRGIQKYQQCEDDIARPALQKVWSAGEVSVSGVPQHDEGRALRPVLLVPSMVNRSYIFNLTQQRSMVSYFAAQGLAPFLLDWGESAQDGGQADFDCLLQERLIPAAAFVRDLYSAPVHVLGYCMGGTFSSALAVMAPELVASVTFLATPWNFHAGGNALRQRVEFWAPAAAAMMAQKGQLDQDWMQMVFATLDPLQTRDKFVRFAEMEEGSEDATLFVALEDWLNDGVHLPADLARGCIQDWFFDNKPAAGQWHVAGELIDPQRIQAPCLVVASERDKLVEYASARGLYDQLPAAEIVRPDCGHIGMIAGGRAIAEAWNPIAAFIAHCKL